MSDKDTLNENLEYCNELAERINILSDAISDAIIALDARVKNLEGE